MGKGLAMIAVYVPHPAMSILRQSFQLTESGESSTEQREAVRIGQQAATLAMEEYASEEQIIATFLHSAATLLPIDSLRSDLAIESNPEAILLAWLRCNFGEKVALPIHLQSQAMRYLYTTMPSYGVRAERAKLVPMSSKESRAFKAQSHFRQSIQVCLWIDRARMIHQETPTCSQFLDFVEEFHERYRTSNAD